MASKSESSLDDDVSTIRDAVMEMGRRMNNHRAQERIAKLAGVEMDKVGEILLMSVQLHGPDVRLSNVAQHLGVELSSVSRKVQKLEEAGLLSRHSDPNDKRASRIFLTDQGQETLEKVQQARWQIIRDALADWSDDDRRTFTQLFTRYISDVAEKNGATNE